MSATDWLLLVVLSVLWGGSFYFAKIAVLEIPPLTLALGRVAIAASALVLFARAVGERFPRDATTWRRFTVMAAFNNVLPFTLLVLGSDPHLDRPCLDPQRHQSVVRGNGGASDDTRRSVRASAARSD